MINMMYLVLTALLALNVSAEILQAFESLRSSLAKSATSQGQSNIELAAHIMGDISSKEQKGNQSYTYVKGLVTDISTQSEDAISFLDAITEKLTEIGEKDPITGELIKKDEVEDNYRFWLGTDDLANDGRGNGKAYELHQRLDQYTEWANTLLEQYDSAGTFPRIQPMVVEPKNDPSVHDKEAKGKKWEYHTFHGKPVIADMAMVEKMKMDVREAQTVLLNLARALSTTNIFTIDSLIAFDAPSAQIVAAGMKFTTTIGVGVAAKNLKPEFLGNGIKINAGGSTATMTMNANGAVIPAGQYEGIQHYNAMIKVPTAAGGFQEIPLKGQFKVRKPEVVVRSKELQLLYKDCGNTLIVDVPALGEEYNPDFSKSTGGKVVRSASNRKEITILPTSQKFNLEVSSSTNGQLIKLDKLTYNVVQPPRPSIIVTQRNNRVGATNPVNRKLPVTVQVKADSDFEEALRKDARYKAGKVKVYYKVGLGPAKLIKEVSGADIQKGVTLDINTGEIRSASAGDRIFFEIEDLKRINYENRSLDIPGMTIYDFTIPAILN